MACRGKIGRASFQQIVEIHGEAGRTDGDTVDAQRPVCREQRPRRVDAEQSPLHRRRELEHDEALATEPARRNIGNRFPEDELVGDAQVTDAVP
jgi:hypothetical protein